MAAECFILPKNFTSEELEKIYERIDILNIIILRMISNSYDFIFSDKEDKILEVEKQLNNKYKNIFIFILKSKSDWIKSNLEEVKDILLHWKDLPNYLTDKYSVTVTEPSIIVRKTLLSGRECYVVGVSYRYSFCIMYSLIDLGFRELFESFI